MLRSITVLKAAESITLYSITVTSRLVLGWIALHEQFIGNKVILKGLIKDLNSQKLTILMIKPIGLYDVDIYMCIGLMIVALAFNLLTITIPQAYIEFSIVACLLIVIPTIGRKTLKVY
ncbi:unnamed protein product [Didymodactylos carnosus]|uniref:Uncharacterized protein n=1 Tax=Didymodactylos carnosus TaxID=1234261 RepID=A0A814T6E3_9BILA|nr:unnamed protein product [Didymodactylos carnosus]CAF1337600.1 unnamed protein product [Didymodactylos carnosus]CAF3918661.1 unnamed protein product [Didymodactylos carnosus]CAF4148856.1 unnamed protein product [Didymodactylos carnosus]